MHVLQGAPLVGITTKPPPVMQTELTRQQRDAIDAFGRSVITIEQAFAQQQGADTPTSREGSSDHGWRIADAWSTHAAAFLRNVIDNAAKPLSRRDGAKPRTAPADQPAQQSSVWQRVSLGVGLPAASGRQATRGREDSFPDQTARRGSYER